MGIPKQSTSKSFPNQWHHEWVGFRPFKFQIKFLQGSEFFQNTLTAMEIGFTHLKPYVEIWKKMSKL